MIIQHRETTDGHREDVCEFLELDFDPLFGGFNHLRPAETHGEHNASRSGTSEPGTHPPIEREPLSLIAPSNGITTTARIHSKHRNTPQAFSKITIATD